MIDIILAASIVFLTLASFRLHSRLRQTESNAAGMSIMLEYLLEESGVMPEDYVEVMRKGIYGLAQEKEV